MRIALSLLVLVVGCNKAHSPSKSVAADALQCARRGVEMSEPFENTWTGADGVLRMRYRVGVSCTKPKGPNSVPKDLWQECEWIDDKWKCGDWQSGMPEGGPKDETPSAIYIDPTERGRALE